jgi:hypothetical protein
MARTCRSCSPAGARARDARYARRGFLADFAAFVDLVPFAALVTFAPRPAFFGGALSLAGDDVLVADVAFAGFVAGGFPASSVKSRAANAPARTLETNSRKGMSEANAGSSDDPRCNHG